MSLVRNMYYFLMVIFGFEKKVKVDKVFDNNQLYNIDEKD